MSTLPATASVAPSPRSTPAVTLPRCHPHQQQGGQWFGRALRSMMATRCCPCIWTTTRQPPTRPHFLSPMVRIYLVVAALGFRPMAAAASTCSRAVTRRHSAPVATGLLSSITRNAASLASRSPTPPPTLVRHGAALCSSALPPSPPHIRVYAAYPLVGCWRGTSLRALFRRMISSTIRRLARRRRTLPSASSRIPQHNLELTLGPSQLQTERCPPHHPGPHIPCCNALRRCPRTPS